MALARRLWPVALFAWLACGGGQEAEDRPPEAEAAPQVQIGGRYEVTGVTLGLTSESQRPIYGVVNLSVEGDRYKAHFELSTPFPGSEATAAKVVGAGEGLARGNVLEGTADTQLLVASVPGVDVGFAYVPREVGPRIVSKSRAEFFADGSVRIEIENQPAPGEDYEPTRTSLVGFHSDPKPD